MPKWSMGGVMSVSIAEFLSKNFSCTKIYVWFPGEINYRAGAGHGIEAKKTHQTTSL